MSEIVAISRDYMAVTLAMTGIHVEEAEDAAEAEEILDALLKSDAVMVIVQEEFRDQLSAWSRERLARHRGLPLVVFCPPFDKENSEVDAYLSAVLKPAVGYEIRLE